MTPNMVIYHIAAVLGMNITSVFYNRQPDGGSYPDNCVTVYSEGGRLNVRSDVRLIDYQAIVRHVTDTTGETWARTILDAVRESNSLETYSGIYLTAAMNNSTDPITFDPDDGSGTSKAAAFSANDYILVGSEVMQVTGVVDDTVTATRAELGSSIAAHSDNDAVHNITKCPVPGMICDSTFSESEVLFMGADESDRMEYAVNWTVRLKTS